MASPMVPNVPVAPQPPRPPRSIAGAIVLIVIGGLFLMGTMGILNWHGLWMMFGKFWPVLLILWGVVKLIEYEQAKRAGYPGRGIGVGGAFLMLFLIVAGLIATGTSRVNWGDLRSHIDIPDDDFDHIFSGETFDYNGDVTKEWPAGANSLTVEDDRGTVTVNVADDKQLKVLWRKKVHADNQGEADGYNSKTNLTVESVAKGYSIKANNQGAGDKGVSTDIDIYVPRDANLVITSGRGDLSINSMAGGAQINHRRGEVNISDMTGNATLDLDGSSARVHHVKGDVTIEGRAKEVGVEDVEGAVHLKGEFQESVRLVRVSKIVSFHSSRTDMEFARLDGRLDLDSGDLRADSLSGPMRLTTRSKDITLEGLSGDLRLEDSNGSVSVGVNKPGNIQIDNRKGDVQLAIPPNTAVKIEARTHGGDIESDFEEIKIENGDHQSSANGSIGNNGPRIAINSEKGTIEIRKGTVVVAPPVPPTPPSSPATPGKPTKALPAPKAKPVESEN